MTQIDVYFNAADVFSVAQRLISKALVARKQLVVWLDASDIQAFDDYLWSFEPASFVPHAIASNAIASHTPILLACDEAQLPPSHDALMINLAKALPSTFSRFERVLDIVGAAPSDKDAGRERYRFYVSRGYPLKSVDLTGP